MWKNKVQFFHTSLQNAWGRFAPFPQASPPSIHKQQNRTFHLLQKPDISICYRHHFDFKESLPELIKTVDAFINEWERHEQLAELSLTHEVEYERDERLSNDNRKFLQHYRYGRFLVEKFVQLQPSGSTELTSDAIAELLALIDR